MNNSIISFGEKILAIITGIAMFLLIMMVLGQYQGPFKRQLLMVFPALLGGFVTGWLVRKRGAFFSLFVILLPTLLFLPLFIFISALSLSYGSDSQLETIIILLVMFLLSATGGFLGEKSYWRFHNL